MKSSILLNLCLFLGPLFLPLEAFAQTTANPNESPSSSVIVTPGFPGGVGAVGSLKTVPETGTQALPETPGLGGIQGSTATPSGTTNPQSLLGNSSPGNSNLDNSSVRNPGLESGTTPTAPGTVNPGLIPLDPNAPPPKSPFDTERP